MKIKTCLPIYPFKYIKLTESTVVEVRDYILEHCPNQKATIITDHGETFFCLEGEGAAHMGMLLVIDNYGVARIHSEDIFNSSFTEVK